MLMRRDIYQKIHPDFKGTLSGQPSVLVMLRGRGTCLVPVTLVDRVAPADCEHYHVESVPNTDRDSRTLRCRNCHAEGQFGPWWRPLDAAIADFLTQFPPAGRLT